MCWETNLVIRLGEMGNGENRSQVSSGFPQKAPTAVEVIAILGQIRQLPQPERDEVSSADKGDLTALGV